MEEDKRKSCRTRPSVEVWKKTKYRRKKTQKWRARSAEDQLKRKVACRGRAMKQDKVQKYGTRHKSVEEDQLKRKVSCRGRPTEQDKV